MSRRTQSINMLFTYKDACIVKHALRDKLNKDADELALYERLCTAVSHFQAQHHIPKRTCYYIYKGSSCNYKGPLLACDKTFEDCKKHDNLQRFPGTPSLKDCFSCKWNRQENNRCEFCIASSEWEEPENE